MPADDRRPAPARTRRPVAPKPVQRFSVGVNYWPRTSATAMWRRFDAGEIAHDFARIAELGLDTVRIFVRWDQFAPHADALDPVMLERFERIVALAAERGLRVLPVLFCGHQSGVNYVPHWALDRTRPRGPIRTFTDTVESPYGIADIYTGPLLEAQERFAREIGGRMRDNAAIVAWDIGHAFTALRAPADGKVASGEHSTAPATELEVAEWSRRLCAALRESSQRPATAGTYAADLFEDRNLRFASLCAPFAFASMQADTVHSPIVRSRLDPDVVPYLALMTAAFSFKPVLVTAFGNPACPAGKFSAFERFASEGEPPNLTIAPDDSVFATYPCLTDDELAAYARAVLERLHAEGRLGAYWWCWADYPADLATQPPFDRAPHERSAGLVRADGSAKPVAAALAAFAAERREVRRSSDMPMIASAYYYRTLPTSTKTVYEAYLGSLPERDPQRP